MSEKVFTIFYLTEKLPILYHIDLVSMIFAGITIVIWILCGLFSISYFKNDIKWKRYAFFYFLVLLVLLNLDFAGNMITFYMFYELMTLSSVMLVMHTQKREAIMAGLKYLFYSLCGAYLVLFGFYFVYQYADTIAFQERGVFSGLVLSENRFVLLIAAFCMILGFSVKAGAFPFHAWLKEAHPAAPAPASAFLSGIIVKAGILGMIRVVFYIFGAGFIKGTWVQSVILILSLITVFMGSILAFRERDLKKRLAYSTISQISYIIFGLFIFHPIAFAGAVLQIVFHAVTKSGLFLCAGAVIHETGKTRVEELVGIGKELPFVLWCFTFCSLSLIGIPPFAGFVSKWNLCIGALLENISFFSIGGTIILLISALLTAGYLLPIVIRGFLPGEAFHKTAVAKKKISLWMSIPIGILSLLSLMCGIFPSKLLTMLLEVANALM